MTGLISKPQAKIIEVGCGMAYLSDIHPGWHGVEYSKSAVARVVEASSGRTRICEGDAQKLSFENCSFDGVFSWAALEHIPDPHLALSEIDRILKPGGYALIAPAWNCRSWTVKKLPQRPYSDLTLIEKIDKFTIPVREHLIFRALRSLPLRISGEIGLFSNRPRKLMFTALHPRWDLIEKYGHVSDDDAVADIDPHAAICFFKSRGYELISHPTAFKRFFTRFAPLIVKKPR